jgi:hypothetical protein
VVTNAVLSTTTATTRTMMIAVLVTTHRADRGGAVPPNSVRFLYYAPHAAP